MFALVTTAFLTGDPRYFALALIGYVPSWLGHLFFEGKEPPTFKYPVLSGLSNFKMITLVLRGEMDPELLRLFGSTNPAPHSPLIVTADQEKAYQNHLKMKVNDDIADHPFQDYWEIFVLKHQKPLNIWVHVIAMYYLYAVLGALIITGNWQWLIAIPLSPLAGLITHHLAEKTHIDFEDALFTRRSFYCLNKMMILATVGRYSIELDRIQKTLRDHEGKRLNIS